MVGRGSRRRDAGRATAQLDEHTRDLLGVHREVLGPGHQGGVVVDLAGRGLGQRRLHPLGQVGIVVGHRIGLGEHRLRLGPVAVADGGDTLLDPGDQVFAAIGREGPHGAAHHQIFRDDVLAQAHIDRRDGHDGGRHPDIDLTGGDLVHGLDDVGRDAGHVDAGPRARAVGLLALHGDRDAVRARIEAHRPIVQQVGVGRADVQAENGVDLGLVQRPVADHQLGAAFLAGLGAFLGRLEDQHHRALDVGLHAGQHGGSSQQHGHMGVVAAGVHDRHGPPLPRRRDLGSERQAGLFLDRQSVHIGAQGHDLAGLAALEDPDHAGLAHALADLEAQGLQLLGDDGGGADLLVAELRMLMNVAAPGDDLGLYGLGGRLDLGGGRRGQGWRAESQASHDRQRRNSSKHARHSLLKAGGDWGACIRAVKLT